MRTSLFLFAVSAIALTATACGNGNNTRDGGTGMDAQRPDGSPACVTGAEDTAAACNDACDNDDDTFVDCEDRGCCALRADCPATSYCGSATDAGPPVDAGADLCPGARTPENTLAACSDGCSNDDDGTFDGGGARIFVDCSDYDCCDPAAPARTDCPASTPCGMRLMRDAGPPRDGGSTACATRGSENTIAACTNGCDDDGNGFFDCGDRGCCLVRTAGGMACGAGTFCADTFNPGTVNLCAGDDVTMPAGREATLAACSNDCDDDRNGYEDCSDRGCCLIRAAGGSACGAGTYCADMFMAGTINLCAGDDVTMAPGTESDATACGNSCDDDRDGYEDCEDRDCCAVRTDCPATTYCGM